MDEEKLRDLVAYLNRKKEHARQEGGAVCETFDPEEMAYIAEAVEERAKISASAPSRATQES